MKIYVPREFPIETQMRLLDPFSLPYKAIFTSTSSEDDTYGVEHWIDPSIPYGRCWIETWPGTHQSKVVVFSEVCRQMMRMAD